MEMALVAFVSHGANVRRLLYTRSAFFCKKLSIAVRVSVTLTSRRRASSTVFRIVVGKRVSEENCPTFHRQVTLNAFEFS